MAPGVAAILDSGGLGRHTFMCGQSGWGKTYALGLLLERVLAETTIRIVVLDPNSDYVRLAHVREGANPLLTARYARVTDDVAVWRDDPEADRPLRLRFADLDPSAQAAVLGLDPVRDREEHAALGELLRLQKHADHWSATSSSLLIPTSPGLGRWACGRATSACSTGASGTRSGPRSLRSCATPRPGARWSTWGRSARQPSSGSSPWPSC
jgi:hypothetical protein